MQRDERRNDDRDDYGPGAEHALLVAGASQSARDIISGGLVRRAGSGSAVRNRSPGSASIAVHAKKAGQSVRSASQPEPPAKNVRPIAINDVSSAYWLALKAPRERDEK